MITKMATLSAETHRMLSEALNAGFAAEEALEYAEINGYFAVEKGFNSAHRPDFPIEWWEPDSAFATLAEAKAAVIIECNWPTRIVNLNGEVIKTKGEK